MTTPGAGEPADRPAQADRWRVELRHPFTIGRTVVLAAVASCSVTWLRVGGDEGDGAIILPLLALPAGAFAGHFLGLAINRE